MGKAQVLNSLVFHSMFCLLCKCQWHKGKFGFCYGPFKSLQAVHM